MDGHLADTIMCRAYKRPGVKNFATKNLAGKAGELASGLASGWNGKLSVVQSQGKYPVRISSSPSASMKREPGSANAANIEQAQDSLDMGGFSNIMLLAHPLAIVYITSCLQDHRMIYVSPQIDSLGFTPEVWLGKPDFRLQQVYEEDSERVDQAFRHSCVTAEKFSCHYRLYDNSGDVHWFHDEASVVCDESGEPLFIRGVMLNITDKKGMEAELAQHRYYLERNVELRTGQLVRRTAVLESCNKALCDKLALAKNELAMLDRRPERTCSNAA